MGHHVDMTRDWPRLGAALRRGRRVIGLTQDQLAQRAGVSRATIQAMERGEPYKKVQPSHRAVARLVGWTDESIERVLEGGEPTAQAPPPTETGATSAAGGSQPGLDLPLRIMHELGEGPLLDAQVLDLTPLGSTARMIVVVKGAPDASPEEIRRDLLAWRRAQGALGELEDRASGSDDRPAGDS